MIEPLVFSMSGQPRGKGRPRATVRNGRPTTYTDELTRKYEASVRLIAQGVAGNRPPLEGAISVSLRFRITPPASASKRLRAAMLSGELPYFGRIDVDNAAKAILDGCNGVLWRDDVLITRLFTTKVAADKPGVDVVVTPLQPEENPAWAR